MRGRTTRDFVQSRANTGNYSQGLQLLQRTSSSMHCIGKQHSIYDDFTAKLGKVAGEGKIVRSGSEVITGSFDGPVLTEGNS